MLASVKRSSLPKARELQKHVRSTMVWSIMKKNAVYVGSEAEERQQEEIFKLKVAKRA